MIHKNSIHKLVTHEISTNVYINYYEKEIKLNLLNSLFKLIF